PFCPCLPVSGHPPPRPPPLPYTPLFRSSLEEPQRAALEDTLSQYALELDQALIKRDQVQDEFRENMREMFRDGDQEGMNDMFERSEEHTSELQSRENLVCRLLPEKKK